MRLTIGLDEATARRFDRLMSYLEGEQQGQIDSAVARMKASRLNLAAVVAAAQQSEEK